MTATRGARGFSRATLLLATTLAAIPAASAQDAGSDQAKVAAGEAVYAMRCAVCHGDDLVTTGQTFDLRRLRADERPRFDNSVRNGKNQMPPWKGVLSDKEIDELWNFVRSKGK
ncbi:MAG TPA: cytochrome c [Xanthobacteraceae bacterium]